MAAKLKQAILISNVIVKCKDIAFVVKIASVNLVFAKKPLKHCDYSHSFSFLFII